MESSGLHQLLQIPGLGKNIARDMLNIGIEDLNGEPIAKQVFPPPVRQALFMCLKAPRPVN